MQFLEKELKRAKQEYEELRQEHNSCCEEFKQEINLRIDAYNKLSRDFWSGKYCNTKFCTQLQAKEQECKNLKEELRECRIGIRNISIENTEICKISEKYKRALDEIENYVRDNSDFDKSDKLTSNTGAYDILEIINKAKEQ